ncbi:uncharacterized protein BT62DRAFT_218593 [Guyanagaster necrorhizus]|uniref:Uncharacterized protein n=1 Tax=Guyanagaster necrorhizus TaxID=856835 RepID=A0A9P7VRI8_9AGAR|nr:uncharacterized protein BT62DRAFT_218593 [Guyanagaster necrorhizus MCA 3950]KAG7444656.1 hypothetical protein BT62DRAFT_218593 [Guyanagaster necrorhizus MCA 3950]
MKVLTPDLAALVGLWCTTVFYGVNLVLYFCCLHVLIRRRTSTSWVLLGAATVQFVLSTVHIAAGLRSMIEGFIWSNQVPEGSYYYWEDMTRPVYILQEATTVTNCLIGDSILVWRLYVIWDKRILLCLFPVSVVLAFGVCGYISVYRISHLSLSDVHMVDDVLNWLQATWSLSLVTQILVTTLIATRIWWLSRRALTRTSRKQSNPYMTVIWTVVESGGVYAFTAALMLAFFTQRSHVSTVMGDALGQISAIVPSLIIVRAGLGYSQTGLSRDSSSAGSRYGGPLHITVDQSVSYDQGYKLEGRDEYGGNRHSTNGV